QPPQRLRGPDAGPSIAVLLDLAQDADRLRLLPQPPQRLRGPDADPSIGFRVLREVAQDGDRLRLLPQPPQRLRGPGADVSFGFPVIRDADQDGERLREFLLLARIRLPPGKQRAELVNCLDLNVPSPVLKRGAKPRNLPRLNLRRL